MFFILLRHIRSAMNLCSDHSDQGGALLNISVHDFLAIYPVKAVIHLSSCSSDFCEWSTV